MEPTPRTVDVQPRAFPPASHPALAALAALALVCAGLLPGPVQATSTEIDLDLPKQQPSSNPLSSLHAAVFGAPVFSPTGRLGGLSALELTPPSYPDVPIPKISARATSITTYRDMLDKLGVNVQAAYGGSGARVSAAVQVARSVEVHESSAYFLLSATMESDPVRLTSAPSFRKGIFPLDDEARRTFYRAFGDGWVSEITLGGSAYALFEVETSSRRERDDLRARFELAASGGELKAGFRKTFSELVGKRSIKVTYSQEGGTEIILRQIEGIAGIDQVLAAIQGLWDTVQEQPVIVRWTMAPYEAVTGPGGPQFLAVPRYQRAVQRAALQHAIAKERLAVLQFALDHPERYIDVDQTSIEGWVIGLEQYVKELEDLTARLEAVEIPERELETRLAQIDQDSRLPPSQVLPREHPLFELFALPNGLPIGQEAFRSPRSFDRKGTCHRRHVEVLTPIRLDIAPDYRSVRYEYKLDVTNRRHKCGDRWKNSDRSSFSVQGFVLAELAIEGAEGGRVTIRINNAADHQPTKSQYATINYGGDPLIEWLRSKDRSVVEWKEAP